MSWKDGMGVVLVGIASAGIGVRSWTGQSSLLVGLVERGTGNNNNVVCGRGLSHHVARERT